MDNRRWLPVTLVTTLLMTGAGVGANIAVDIYGLFRDSADRDLQVFGDDRLAKYLLSARYVHANFDGVLIGSSVSANWDVGTMSSVRLYNESVNGGNVVEEKAILGSVLERPGTRLVLLVVHPYITASHQFKTVDLSQRQVWSALGSQNLLEAYKSAVKVRLGREAPQTDAAGTVDFGDGTQKLNDDLAAMMKPGEDFQVDPVALQTYRDMVAELHAKQIPIAFVIPPTSEPIFAAKREAFARYSQLILASRLPEDRVLDFLSDEFAAFRQDVSQFSDGVHLRRSSARKLTALIDARLETWIAEGWLSRSAAPADTRR